MMTETEREGDRKLRQELRKRRNNEGAHFVIRRGRVMERQGTEKEETEGNRRGETEGNQRGETEGAAGGGGGRVHEGARPKIKNGKKNF